MSLLLFYISVPYSVLVIILVDCLTVQRYYFSLIFSISFSSNCASNSLIRSRRACTLGSLSTSYRHQFCTKLVQSHEILILQNECCLFYC